jgi:hypothetical protein
VAIGGIVFHPGLISPFPAAIAHVLTDQPGGGELYTEISATLPILLFPPIAKGLFSDSEQRQYISLGFALGPIGSRCDEILNGSEGHRPKHEHGIGRGRRMSHRAPRLKPRMDLTVPVLFEGGLQVVEIGVVTKCGQLGHHD